jgi:DIM1 family U5 snRNP protein
MLIPQAIMVEEDRVVCIRFGHDHNEDCMAMDETLYGVSEKVQNFAVIYLGPSQPSSISLSMASKGVTELMVLVDITEVPDFNKVSSRASDDRPRGELMSADV